MGGEEVAQLEAKVEAALEHLLRRMVARRVLAGTGAEAKVGDDGVPTWLRKRFQAEVHRQYSDHLPVYCMLS